MRRFHVLGCSAITLISAACGGVNSSEQATLEDDLRAIDAIRNEHVLAVNTTNADLLLRAMSEQVVYLGPGIDPVLGAPALRALLEPMYQQVRPQLSMIPTEVQVVGDVAYEWGMISGTMALGDAPPQRVNSKYVFVYRRQADSSWRIVYDIYNDNPPLATSGD